MAFEVFERRAVARSKAGSPSVRVSSNGRLMIFNASAARLIGDVRYLRLLYDRDADEIGFQPTRQDDENGFSVGRPKSSANVHAVSFVKKYSIPVGQIFPLEEEDGIFVARVRRHARV